MGSSPPAGAEPRSKTSLARTGSAPPWHYLSKRNSRRCFVIRIRFVYTQRVGFAITLLIHYSTGQARWLGTLKGEGPPAQRRKGVQWRKSESGNRSRATGSAGSRRHMQRGRARRELKHGRVAEKGRSSTESHNWQLGRAHWDQNRCGSDAACTCATNRVVWPGQRSRVH